MPKERIITGVDVGSSKIAVIIASVIPEERISVIGVSSVPSRGIKKGVVVDIDEAVEAIAEGLEAAERMAGCAVSSAYVSVDGKHISSLNSHGVVAVSAESSEISEEDVERVTEAARAISIPNSREIIHVLPRGFVVDSQDGVKDPIGMSGVRLEVETDIISGSTTVMRNLVKCVQQVGVDVEDLVFCGLAASEAVLSDTEKELGTVLVDIGGGTTQIVVFTNGSPVYSAVLPIGGGNITNDLAVGLRASLEDAERIKIRLAERGLKESEEKKDEIDISDLGLEVKSIPKSLVQNIIEARLSEIFSMVGLEIKNSGQQGNLPAGLVVTGGGAGTLGLDEVAKKVLRLPLRVGQPTGVTGLIDEVSTPAYASSIGLVIYGSYIEPGEKIRMPFINTQKFTRFFGKVVEWGRSFLP
ncbi:cell division protein FtsA [candidate division WWE3 bacterium CG09_land_8_20_14_0_10_47_33]|uniref:Cell division protein FtsA n=1 Tax=candidate division WWE3 bacterium CG_4_9_14_0_2_um_filter_48_10 TaxID=1975078 RepID=A0A2M8EJ63_UNCKA|nr:MAG: cell division protein FtsA [candidate division WWE3 bacterium CG09_land_8_20_14_0_10_47_33]PJC22783.1 MAG: cell division protein FtsA [candidate division WWE3 bacterium CG_4_9_14_0_2_um_filter_48_10]PJE52312.1 MAG: cell division protein FtsA [candidate division WWE3 bacterium CG10_big_fil_rev_8_21_14_0_10_48_23]